MGCRIQKEKKSSTNKDLETCSKKNLDQPKNNDQSDGELRKLTNDFKTRANTLAVSTNNLNYEIIHSNDKAKLRIINYYIDLDGRIIAKSKEIKHLKEGFQLLLDNNNIRIRRQLKAQDDQ